MRLTFLIVLLALVTACKQDVPLRTYAQSNKEWQLTTLNGKPFMASATISFPEEGRVSGNAPCNSYSATMTASYPSFELGPIAATKRACPNLAAEAAFFAALDVATLSEMSNKTMILSNPNGLNMVFSAGD